MAQNSAPNHDTKLILLCLLGMAFISVESIGANVGLITLNYYLQEIRAGPNATEIPVAGIQGKAWTNTQFGTIFVADNLITQGPDLKSSPVARFEGLFAVASLDGRNFYGSVSIIFTNTPYNGSTIELQGIYKQFEAVKEVAVTSGTGRFRFASGYATFDDYYVAPDGSYNIVRLNITLPRRVLAL